ncbi:hypothetical protein Tco_1449671 [Tanacetum coccineum]
MTHPHPNRKFVPQVVLTRSGKTNTAGVSVNTVVRPFNTAGSKPTVNHPRPISNAYKMGHSQVIRPFNKYSTNKNSIFNKKVNTVKVKDTTTKDRAVAHDKCYLTEYEDYDGGFISFRDGKGRISRKGKIKTGTLDFDNVYFCKDLKYNLFSVSQICDIKNNLLFTNTECLVLSSNFKLLDKSQVLLRVPRKDNIYSVNLKSVVPTKGLTCLFAKATIDESNLWHRRLGVHDTFHVSNLKKCLADASLHVPLDEIKVDKTLRFVEEPVEIMDSEIKSLKCSRISLVKVRWNCKRGPEFTWEREDYMKSKYPQLFVERTDESAS